MAENTENETPETEVTPEAEAAPEETPVAEETPVPEETAAPEEAAAPEETPVAEDTATEDVAAEEAPAEEPAAAPAPEAEAAPAPQSQPKKKKKRLPRALRAVKTRPRRPAATGEQKPIVREAKPEHPRGRRQERRGVVVSSAMDKTIVVKVDVIKSHPKYKKVVRRSVKFHAHDEENSANIGDVVRIVETRPLSKTKHWRLAEIVEVAK
jgi:small subunit ribosomal protein S17